MVKFQLNNFQSIWSDQLQWLATTNSPVVFSLDKIFVSIKQKNGQLKLIELKFQI